jgi:hypothetical protein
MNPVLCARRCARLSGLLLGGRTGISFMGAKQPWG